MAIPKPTLMHRPILQLLSDGQPHGMKSMIGYLVSQFHLTQAETEITIPSGNQALLFNRLAWAVTYLYQARCMDKVSKGVYQITQRGHSFLKIAPEEITSKDLMQFPEFIAFKSRAKKAAISVAAPTQEAETEMLSPEEAMGQAAKELFAALQSDLLEQVKQMTPARFEGLVVQLMLRLGYGGPMADAGITLGKSGDEGVDGVISQDKLGLDKIYLQAKRYTKNAVSREEVQSFAGALAGKQAVKGVFITTADFSKSAAEYARSPGAFKISLINGEELARLMIETNLGVSVKTTYEVKRVDSDFFSEE